MSEYQCYEFQAIDRPLDRAAQDAIRSVSSRARITATSFTNEYNWGDFKGDPRKFMERWFDLHLYIANWGTRRLMMRVPARLLTLPDIAPFLEEVDWVKVWIAGDNLIVDICRDEIDLDDHWIDDSDRLAALAPLRSDVLSGDLRLFYLPWLAAVQDEVISDGDVEPLPGIGPLTGALAAFAEVFGIDPDLVQAAAETAAVEAATGSDGLRDALAAISDGEKTDLLLRVVEGDSLVAAELVRRLRKRPEPSAPRRTAGALRSRAGEIAEARERAEAERREAERRRQAAAAEQERRVRIEALRRRGTAAVWREIEVEIQRRNASGYDRAVNLLADLRALAAEEGNRSTFDRRLASIRVQHGTKRKFIERLAIFGGDERLV